MVRNAEGWIRLMRVERQAILRRADIRDTA